MLKTPVLAIFRGIKLNHVADLIDCCIHAGIDTVEVTMNTNSAPEIIKAFKKQSKNKLIVGAGTVITLDHLETALDVGAEFIVTPIINTDVIDNCIENNIEIIPGALTPTKVWSLWNKGVKLIKVFPANLFGSEYFKALNGLFNQIKTMAVGGNNRDNIASYFLNGASAVPIGGSVFSYDRLEINQFDLTEADLTAINSTRLIKF